MVASVLLGAAVLRRFAVVNPADARRAALQHTVVRLREGFRRKGIGSSSSFSEGRDSSVVRSSSVDGAHGGDLDGSHKGESVRSWNGPQGGGGSMPDSMPRSNSDKANNINKGSVVALYAPGVCDQRGNVASSQTGTDESEGGAAVAEKQTETGAAPHAAGSPAPTCSGTAQGPAPGSAQESDAISGGLVSSDQQTLDHNLVLMFQEKLNHPGLTSLLAQRNIDLKRKGAEQDLTAVLQDRGLDPNFAMMVADKEFDPQIFALLQRSSLDADRDHKDNSKKVGGVGSQSRKVPTEDASTWSDELKRNHLEKWVQFVRQVVVFVAGTPERMWALFSLAFIADTVIVGIFRPEPVIVINASHEQVVHHCHITSQCGVLG